LTISKIYGIMELHGIIGMIVTLYVFEIEYTYTPFLFLLQYTYPTLISAPPASAMSPSKQARGKQRLNCQGISRPNAEGQPGPTEPPRTYKLLAEADSFFANGIRYPPEVEIHNELDRDILCWEKADGSSRKAFQLITIGKISWTADLKVPNKFNVYTIDLTKVETHSNSFGSRANPEMRPDSVCP
jgi:hypothetical protein